MYFSLDFAGNVGYCFNAITHVYGREYGLLVQNTVQKQGYTTEGATPWKLSGIRTVYSKASGKWTAVPPKEENPHMISPIESRRLYGGKRSQVSIQKGLSLVCKTKCFLNNQWENIFPLNL